MKLWSGRFREPLDPEFERWQQSFAFDRRLLPEEIAASRAYAHALEKAGILAAAETQAIINALEQIAAETPGDKPGTEDIHQYVEDELVKRVGDAGYKLHAGRSRNEQIAVDLRLFTRGSIDAIRAALGGFVEASLNQAEKHTGAAMPSYTHMQRAEPVLVAHWLLAYVEMFLRDAERLADCRRRVNVLPLGSGAVAGPGLALDRVLIARELGFESISANSMDATSDRDFALEFVNTLALVAVHLSRWAEELALFSTVEYGFVVLPESHSTGSSAMPQKKNPDALELLRGKAGPVTGAAVALLMTVKGLPLAYNKDLQETQPPLFDAADTVLDSLKIASSLLNALRFDTGRMQQAATSGFLNATAAARYLVSRGVPFRLAHAAIGQAVRLCLDKGCELDGLSLEELRQFRPEFDQGFYEALKLESVLASHDVPAGTAPARVREALAAARKRVAELRSSTPPQ
jgi:argininosuccinate lyase